MISDEFAVFVHSYQRLSFTTIKTLHRLNYTGKIYLQISDEDKYIEKYKEVVKDYKNVELIIYKKERDFDLMTNINDLRSQAFAYNASIKIAKRLGLKYFLILDDDYKNFYFKKGQGDNASSKVKNLDNIFFALINFLKNTNIFCLSITQTGDQPYYYFTLFRKAMNFLLFETKKIPDDFKFLGFTNEDVNTYLRYGNIGYIFLTYPQVTLRQTQTQMQEGGYTEVYIDYGTFYKSFFSVMILPSACRVKFVSSVGRLHHFVKWDFAVPKILPYRYN